MRIVSNSGTPQQRCRIVLDNVAPGTLPPAPERNRRPGLPRGKKRGGDRPQLA